MGKSARIHRHRHHLFCHRITHLVMSLFLLYLSGSSQPRYSAEGRAVPELVHANPNRLTEEEGQAAVEQSLIGSRPPSCDGRCKSCVRCMAVQVPVAPQIRSHFMKYDLAYARGDDISNYKPMTWKCKCGDYFFNP